MMEFQDLPSNVALGVVPFTHHFDVSRVSQFVLIGLID